MIWSKNVERSIIDIVRKYQPGEVSTGAATIVANECKELSRKNSNSVLQGGTLNDILSFTWDKFHKELTLRAPNTLRIVSSMLSDVPMSPGGKPFVNLMHTISMALHSRYNQMSLTQYLCGFILLHGGCTKRVRVINLLQFIGILKLYHQSRVGNFKKWSICVLTGGQDWLKPVRVVKSCLIMVK
jgi:hypothetical protein